MNTQQIAGCIVQASGFTVLFPTYLPNRCLRSLTFDVSDGLGPGSEKAVVVIQREHIRRPEHNRNLLKGADL
jgi:hypothetical protein